jgi:hypothetical protein
VSSLVLLTGDAELCHCIDTLIRKAPVMVGPSGTSPQTGRRVAVVMGVALGVVALLLFMPAAAAVVPAHRVVAWAALVAAAAAGLWLPLRRFRSWPGGDRRAAVAAVGRAALAALPLAYLASALGAAATVLVIGPEPGFVPEAWAVPLAPAAWPFLLLAVVALLFALRPVTPLAAATWAARRGLAAPTPTWVARELRRLRVWRTVPAVLGAGLGAGPSVASARWLEVHGPARAAEGMVLAEASMVWPFDPFTLALTGYLLGLAIAEATRRHPSSVSPAARLTVRVPSSYLTRPARRIPSVFAGVTVVASTVAWAAGEAVWWPAVAAVVLVAVVLVVQRWVVRRPQRLERPVDLHADDVLRSSAAHGLSGASGALLLITAVGATDAAFRALGFDVFAGAIAGAVLAGLFIGGVWALWLGYGSAHRGRVPSPPQAARRFEEPVA